MKSRSSCIIYILLLLVGLNACKENSLPKPHGYFRIDIPKERDYNFLTDNLQCQFEYSGQADIRLVTAASDSFWMDIVYPQLNGKIYLSYKSLENSDLDLLVEDARKFVFKHSVKASAIDESVIRDDTRKLYGMLYDLGGDVASNTQFYLTDSNQHFLRAALYFKASPDRDSLDPVINHVREDILHLIETFEWKD